MPLVSCLLIFKYLKNDNKRTSCIKDAFEIVLTVDDSSRFRIRTSFLVGELVPSSSLFWSISSSWNFESK